MQPERFPNTFTIFPLTMFRITVEKCHVDGYAAAVSYVVLVIIVLITIVQKKVTGDHDE